MQTGDKVKLVKALSGLPSTTDDATIYFSVSDHKIYLGDQSYGDGTTYNFVSGTNGFTVTPSGGSAQTVTVTPIITNNITGSGTSGYIAKFNGVNTITDGPALGSDTNTFLRNDGTWKDPINNFASNAGFHNSIYHGKFLGTSITAEQYAQISAGTFDDMFIGDYWTISTTFGNTTKNVDYVIAGFDYWWNVGDSYPPTNRHHIVLVPRDVLYSDRMNSTDTTTGGYVGSEMYTTNLADARTGIGNVFSGHIYSMRKLLTNSVGADGQANNWTWTTCSVELMSETMVYGAKVWGNSGFEVGSDMGILPLFALNPASRNSRSMWWLRSVVSPSHFAYVVAYGYVGYNRASGSFGVRPCFAIF